MNVDHLLAAADSLRALAIQLRATAAPVPVPTASPEWRVEQVASHVTIRKAAQVTGYTERAIEEKIAKGVWLKGREWMHAPDGRRLIIMKGYEQWVMRGR